MNDQKKAISEVCNKYCYVLGKLFSWIAIIAYVIEFLVMGRFRNLFAKTGEFKIIEGYDSIIVFCYVASLAILFTISFFVNGVLSDLAKHDAQ
ncbi:hypothetical protein [Candidatus Enterovibrio escicola]|uniref:hypothetical protein n=1 Tax=Candidatus Enterovibrio escicola TaxID=1927127 RepID=UPI00123837A0|nr:hypothetical protein [Candidatus Enterovibrio escacola]